jgi:hypothetical protein
VCVRIILPVGYFRVNRFFPLKKKILLETHTGHYQIPQLQQEEEDSSSSSEGSKCVIVFLTARWPVDNFQMETKKIRYNRIALFTFFLLLVFFFTLFDDQ